jgi:hypothetical protein
MSPSPDLESFMVLFVKWFGLVTACYITNVDITFESVMLYL